MVMINQDGEDWYDPWRTRLGIRLNTGTGANTCRNPLRIRARDFVRTAAETRYECADRARRARSELAEIRAATRKTIIGSRELIADIDSVLAER